MNHKKLSKLLSYLLRHRPDALGLQMNQQGWVDLDELLRKLNENGTPVSLELLCEVVETNDKQRFKLDLSGNRIRASQGHSVPVELELSEQEPPDILYHGTALRNLEQIRREGLKKMNRQHVHLSPDEFTAKKVGGRHGTPIVLQVDCRLMRVEGQSFFRSENGVWLTDHVAPRYLMWLPD